MNKEKFKKALSSIRIAKNKRASYHGISVRGNVVFFIRESKIKKENTSISELYNLYKKEDFIDTVIAQKYISGWVYSPSVAILKAAGLVGEDGERLGYNEAEVEKESKHGDHIVHYPSSKKKKLKPEDKGTNDEKQFFEALKTIVGHTHLYAKSVGLSVDKEDVYLSDNFTKYQFHSVKINRDFEMIFNALNGINPTDSKSLAHHVDGLIHEHSKFGTRIVEFDEEQHFTPARKETLIILSQSFSIPYAASYIEICDNLDYLNDEVLKKHRIKEKLESLPESFSAFAAWLSDSKVRLSGYIESKKNFDYKGGRIAQRAYYDSLRDVAHLSKYNKKIKLKPPLRFAKKSFEDIYGKLYTKLSHDEIKEGILEIMKNVYKL